MTTRRLAIAAGALYLTTHVTSVAAVALYQPMLAADGISAPWSESRIILGALLDVILALAVVGSSAALYPVLKRKAPGIALGNVGLRILEAGVIATGVVAVLTVVSVRQDAVAGGDTAALFAAGQTLMGIYEWAFIVGPNLVLPTSTLFLAFALFRTGLVPRWIGLLGMVGAPLIFGRAVGSMFGLYEHISVWGAILTIPIFAWELSLAFRLVFKGYDLESLEEPAGEGAAQSSPTDGLIAATR